MKNYKVYKHTFPNGKIYIGITKQKPEYRWGHKGNGYCQHPLLVNAINKYGWENIKHEILFDNLTKEEAEQKEIELIAFYKSNQSQFGYNIANGGFREGKNSLKTRQKMSKSSKGKKQSLETRLKRSMSLKGLKKSQEWIDKIAKSNKGRKPTQETIDKMIKNASKRIVCVETGVEYLNAREALRSLGCKSKKPTNIHNAVNKENKTAYGFHWRYSC